MPMMMYGSLSATSLTPWDTHASPDELSAAPQIPEEPPPNLVDGATWFATRCVVQPRLPRHRESVFDEPRAFSPGEVDLLVASRPWINDAFADLVKLDSPFQQVAMHRQPLLHSSRLLARLLLRTQICTTGSLQ